MIVDDGEQLNLKNYEFYQPTGLEEGWEEPEETERAEGNLLMYSMAGITTARTMRLYGITGGKTITVLIDS